jgi:hypothetical protein
MSRELSLGCEIFSHPDSRDGQMDHHRLVRWRNEAQCPSLSDKDKDTGLPAPLTGHCSTIMSDIQTWTMVHRRVSPLPARRQSPAQLYQTSAPPSTRPSSPLLRARPNKSTPPGSTQSQPLSRFHTSQPIIHEPFTSERRNASSSHLRGSCHSLC